MSVIGLAMDASNRSPIILLRDQSGRRQVPIWVDHEQARNIIAGIDSYSPNKPLSHDLMICLLDAGNLHLDRIIIHSVKENAFEAVLKLKRVDSKKKRNVDSTDSTPDSPLIEIESRPSDAIALAVRTPCSIWMLEEVVAEASIPVDAEADQQDQNQFRSFINDISPADLIRQLKDNSQVNEEIIDPNKFNQENPN